MNTTKSQRPSARVSPLQRVAPLVERLRTEAGGAGLLLLATGSRYATAWERRRVQARTGG